MDSPNILFIDFCFKPYVIIILFTESSFENGEVFYHTLEILGLKIVTWSGISHKLPSE
jgi:hypothetical protein